MEDKDTFKGFFFYFADVKNSILTNTIWQKGAGHEMSNVTSAKKEIMELSIPMYLDQVNVVSSFVCLRLGKASRNYSRPSWKMD